MTGTNGLPRRGSAYGRARACAILVTLAGSCVAAFAQATQPTAPSPAEQSTPLSEKPAPPAIPPASPPAPEQTPANVVQPAVINPAQPDDTQPPALPPELPGMVLPEATTDAPAEATPIEPYALPRLAPAITRLLAEDYLTEGERRALRVRHGQWTREDLADAESAAQAALIVGDLEHAALLAEGIQPLTRARAMVARGEFARALEVLEPLTSDGNNAPLLALRLKAEALDALGRRDEANATLDPLVQRVAALATAQALPDADEIAEGVRGMLLWVRWKGPTQAGGADYRQLLALLKRAREDADPLNWNVLLAEGELLADKDNYPDAAAALSSALSLNPRLAGAWAMLGQLAINGFDIERGEQIAASLDANVAFLREGENAPALQTVGEFSPDAALVLARARLRQKDAAAAERVLDPFLARLPSHLELAAARAAASASRFDYADADKRLAAIDALSPGSALGYSAVGQTLSEARQYADAAKYLEEAARRAPSWASPVVELGLLEVQSGRNDRALTALEKAVTLDPFNVRVRNSLKLVSDLREFATIESDHFIVRYKPGIDEALAREMPEVLERIHKRVTGDSPGGVRHEPPFKTVIELMPDHQWFSVRITGMPRIHTIAAATGPLVAMEAPRTGPGHSIGVYDWPRVVQHEYTHTVTLSRTNNRLPHWFTEAAAVYLEDAPRDWKTIQLLAATVENDQLFTLDEINLAFVRPKRPSDRQLAYAQGHWMYQYIVERFGPEAPLKLMDAYAQGVREDDAYQSLLATTREQFLIDFTAYAKKQLEEWGVTLPDGTPSIPALLKEHNESLKASGGEELEEPTAELLDRWLTEHPTHPDLLLSKAERELAIAGDQVTPELVPLLERYATARPVDPLPHRLLARYYLDGKGGAGSKDLAIPHLEFLDVREQYAPTYAKELARLHAARGDWDRARRSASRAVEMSPYDGTMREFAATIAMQNKELDLAKRHLEALIILEPTREIHKQRLAALEKIRATQAPK